MMNAIFVYKFRFAVIELFILVIVIKMLRRLDTWMGRIADRIHEYFRARREKKRKFKEATTLVKKEEFEFDHGEPVESSTPHKAVRHVAHPPPGELLFSPPTPINLPDDSCTNCPCHVTNVGPNEVIVLGEEYLAKLEPERERLVLEDADESDEEDAPSCTNPPAPAYQIPLTDCCEELRYYLKCTLYKDSTASKIVQFLKQRRIQHYVNFTPEANSYTGFKVIEIGAATGVKWLDDFYKSGQMRACTGTSFYATCEKPNIVTAKPSLMQPGDPEPSMADTSSTSRETFVEFEITGHTTEDYLSGKC